jgi:hypothetical protein
VLDVGFIYADQTHDEIVRLLTADAHGSLAPLLKAKTDD